MAREDSVRATVNCNAVPVRRAVPVRATAHVSVSSVGYVDHVYHSISTKFQLSAFNVQPSIKSAVD